MTENAPQENPRNTAQTQSQTLPENASAEMRVEQQSGAVSGQKESLLALTDNGSYETAADRQPETARAEGKAVWTGGLTAITRAIESGKAEGFAVT